MFIEKGNRMYKARKGLIAATAGIAISAATTAVAVTSCFVPLNVECCSLLTTSPSPSSRYCTVSGNCVDVILSNPVPHFQNAATNQAGQDALIPTEKCTCTFDQYQCSLSGYCVLKQAGVTNTGGPSVPNGAPCVGG